MEIVLGIFFLVILVAAIFGWTTDSRDYADRKPSHEGFRST
jgi:hypothetical protein